MLTFVVLDYAEHVDDFLDRGATARQVFGTFYPNYVPEIVRLTSPLAIFLAAIYVTARLAQSMQLQALHSAGVSLWRYMRPFVLVATLFTAGMLAFNGFVVPRSNVVTLDFQNRYLRDAPESPSQSEIYLQTDPGVVLATGFYDREQARAYRVSLITVDSSGGRSLVARLEAPEMEWVDSLAVWRLRDAVVRRFDARGEERFRRVAQLDTALSVLPRDLARSERDADRLTIPEARAYVASLERSGVKDRGRPLVGYYSKFSYPMANLILVLIGVPMAARRRRGGQAAQLGLGLAVAFVYLALQRTLEPLGFVDEIPPLVASWAPHVLFAAFALWMLWHVRR